MKIAEPVHYVSYGTPGGEYASKCRAAFVAETTPSLYETQPGIAEDTVTLVVLNPTGIFFDRAVRYDPFEQSGGSYHKPSECRWER